MNFTAAFRKPFQYTDIFSNSFLERLNQFCEVKIAHVHFEFCPRPLHLSWLQSGFPSRSAINAIKSHQNKNMVFLFATSLGE